LQCAAVCCSTMQCDAVFFPTQKDCPQYCCIVLQRVAACGSGMQYMYVAITAECHPAPLTVCVVV